jgi:hypothetical protein
MKIFIAGPRAVSKLTPDINNRLHGIFTKGYNILVGDASGVDKAVQHYFSQLGYRNVVIYASNGKARNNLGNWRIEGVSAPDNIKGFDFYAMKDKAMDTSIKTPEVDIRDYFLDKSSGANKKTSALDAFEVVLQNNTDFIIARTTAKSIKELVVLISQGLFYFKEKKRGKIEDVTFDGVKTFIKGLRDDSIALDQVLWFPALNKESVNRLINVITDDTFIEMCRHNVLANIMNPTP